MASSDLPANLKLLCSYAPSIKAACARMGMNRQQFHRYLSGDAEPSLQGLRKIADHFGLDDAELLYDHERFRQLVAIKRPISGAFSSVSARAREILMLNAESRERLIHHTGYYHNYFCPAEYPGKILRGLIRVFEEDGIVFSRNFERYPSDRNRYTKKFNGIFVHSGDRVLMFEREMAVGKMAWLTVLYPHDRDQPSLLTGLSLGITSSSQRDIACYRVILQHLGERIDMRAALGRCGLYDTDDPRIDPLIATRVRNEMRPDEFAFSVRA